MLKSPGNSLPLFMPPLPHPRHILLADDDKDDSLLFRDVFAALFLPVHLTTLYNGEQLMQLLNGKEPLPDILFLDLNMPRINGLECLSEIKHTEKLQGLPVIIFSTSCEPAVVDLLYKNGAQYYIRKPNNFGDLKKVIYQALVLTSSTHIAQPSRERFVLSPQPVKNESN